ncbi:hypothetical protein, partial [Bradyrhizobium sp. CCBAU 21362]|uniref:hypothetical protein n=1 Tax=Bradyrhizobium sp. CCBAU 21362 TaxID=1325082 RepID=UPI0023065351
MIELYMACFAMTFGFAIALDHPVRSKGDNPDVMLNVRGELLGSGAEDVTQPQSQDDLRQHQEGHRSDRGIACY